MRVSVPPLFSAYLSAIAFSGMDALLGYLLNIAKIPVFEIICFRMASRLPPRPLRVKVDQACG